MLGEPAADGPSEGPPTTAGLSNKTWTKALSPTQFRSASVPPSVTQIHSEEDRSDSSGCCPSAGRDNTAVPSPTPFLSLNWETLLPNYNGPGSGLEGGYNSNNNKRCRKVSFKLRDMMMGSQPRALLNRRPQRQSRESWVQTLQTHGLSSNPDSASCQLGDPGQARDSPALSLPHL